MISKKNAIELFGWYGAAAILLAYALVSFKVVEPNSLVYQLLNFTGALGIVTISLAKKARQPAALNIAWAAIAGLSIVGLFVS